LARGRRVIKSSSAGYLVGIIRLPETVPKKKYALTIRPVIDDRARPVAPLDAIPVVTGWNYRYG